MSSESEVSIGKGLSLQLSDSVIGEVSLQEVISDLSPFLISLRDVLDQTSPRELSVVTVFPSNYAVSVLIFIFEAM